MFSAQYYKEIKDAFDRQMALLDERCHRLRHNMAEGETVCPNCQNASSSGKNRKS